MEVPERLVGDRQVAPRPRLGRRLRRSRLVVIMVMMTMVVIIILNIIRYQGPGLDGA